MQRASPGLALFAAVGLILTLSACADRGDRVAEDVATTSPTPAPPADRPVVDASSPAAPTAATDAGQGAPTAEGPARFDGYGELRFGMTAEMVERTWDGELDGPPRRSDACYYLHPPGNPSIAWFALMIADGRFVRYDVANNKVVAPGGGQRGMTIAGIRQLYPGRVEQSPHKYAQGGKYLRIEHDHGDGVLIFETDASGVVTDWHVGLPPQAGYIEGCA